ncbi:hypothetical protein ACLOJK_038491 [Asimina triloba]
MRLLSRQFGIKNFAPLKPLFLDLRMGNHSYFQAFASASVIPMVVEKGWSESGSPNVRSPPELVYKFSQLDEKLLRRAGATFAPIYRKQKDVLCPYCVAWFVPSIEGQLRTICDLAVVEADASALLCSSIQI